jgi:tRNA-guanine family transglycosylase
MDSSAFITAAGKRDYIVPGYRRVLIHNIERIDGLCECPVCTSHSLSEIASKRSLLSLHNLWVQWSELQQIRNALAEGDLEEYLKERFSETPWAKAAFGYARRRIRFGLVGGYA